MPRAARMRPWGLIGLAAFVAASIALLFAFAPNRQAAARGGGLALAAPLPDEVPKGTILVVGDPVTQWVFEHNGWQKQLPFTIKWAQITGGPDVTEAFHAKALDVGLGANVPPIHAVWVGLPVKIIAFRQRRDPLRHPAFVLALAPKAGIRTLADLRGKRIAFSPSQVQGQIVLQTLKAAGLGKDDVKLVELPSSIGGDVYTSALASNLVDVAPIGSGIVAQRYLRKFGHDEAKILNHADFRDDAVFAYVPVEVLENPAKAAALKQFVRWWGRAQAWQKAHPDELAKGYYVGDQGLSLADARLIIAAAGDIEVPGAWDQAVAYQQAAVDLMAPEMDKPRFDAASLFDRRFETIAADAFAPRTAAAATPRR
jgi:sulfonate transport system substrate-binding protein